MQTYTTTDFDAFKFEPKDIKLCDIIQSSALGCRFNGHCNFFYSHAQHSLMIYRHAPKRLKAAALLFDAYKTYVGDLTKVMEKITGEGVRNFSSHVQSTIFEAFDIPVLTYEDYETIKHLKDRALATEYRDIMSKGKPWPNLKGVRVYKNEVCKPQEISSVVFQLASALDAVGLDPYTL